MADGTMLMMTISFGSLFVLISAMAIVFFKAIKFAALAVPAQQAARKHLNVLRFEKMDKESVMVITLMKSGSTLLCYVCALLNTRNAIRKFRNDFDLIPMLSFDQPMIHQNVNARQDGKYQLYKINGRAKIFYESLKDDHKIKKVVWMCRDFNGYYRSAYWWIKAFYPRITPLPITRLKPMFFLRFMTWDLFKSLTLRQLAEDHVDELWYVYSLLKKVPKEEFLALSYEHLTEEKPATLDMISAWLGIDANDEMIQSIAMKTSKEAMIKGDRFDPLHFGEGGGQTKVNLKPHKHTLNAKEIEIYDEIFKRRFAPVGITSYREYIGEIRKSYR